MNRVVFTVFIVVIGLLSLLKSERVKADDALYARLPPPEASFFRFVNATSNELDISEGGERLATLRPYQVSKYGFVPQKMMQFDVSGKTFAHNAVAEKVVTIIVTDDESVPFKTIEENRFDNKRKARIKLFNLTDSEAVALKTSDGKHLVIADVSAMELGHRDVNAVRMEFSAFSAEEAIATTEPLTLKRDIVTSIFVFDAPTGTRMSSIESGI